MGFNCMVNKEGHWVRKIGKYKEIKKISCLIFNLFHYEYLRGKLQEGIQSSMLGKAIALKIKILNHKYL